MKIGLWNIDHPEHHADRTSRRYQRMRDILTFLKTRDCDLFILTETNAALQLPGYHAYLSAESPYRKASRDYRPPNRYHQVGIYSRFPLEQMTLPEPINGVLCKTLDGESSLWIYGNVITIKDRWQKDSTKTYRDRLEEQLDVFEALASKPRCIIAGDFNLKVNWAQKRGAFRRLRDFVNQHGWIWPTETQTESVQHIIHSPHLMAKVALDMSVKGRWSDHPFFIVDIQPASLVD